VLHLSAASLSFASALEFFFYPAWLRTSEGLAALSSLLAVGGYAAAFAGFLHATPRRRLLGLAGIFFAASGAAGAADHVVRSVEYTTHPVGGKFQAAEIVGAAGSLAFVAAGVVVAVAFLSSREGRRRDLVLGWAAVALVAYFCLTFVSLLLYAIAYSDLHAPSGVASGLGVQAAGFAVAVGGAVVAARAFLRSDPDGEWQRLAHRDGLLAEAATIVGLGSLGTAIGAMVYAGALSDLETDTKQLATNWLSGVSYLGLACAAICAGVAFRASRRELEQRDGSDPAAFADPG